MNTLEEMVRNVLAGWPIQVVTLVVLVKACWEGARYGGGSDRFVSMTGIVLAVGDAVFVGLHEIGHVMVPSYSIITMFATVVAWAAAASSELIGASFRKGIATAVSVRYVGASLCMLSYAALRLRPDPNQTETLLGVIAGVIGFILLVVGFARLYYVLARRYSRTA